MTEAQLVDLVLEAYPISEDQLVEGIDPESPPRTLKEAAGQVDGDTLLKFIFLELGETAVGENGKVDLQEAHRVMVTASRDIERVIAAIENAKD
jgi:hypothetical protein